MLALAAAMATYEWSRIKAKRPLFNGRQVVTLYWCAYLSFVVLGVTAALRLRVHSGKKEPLPGESAAPRIHRSSFVTHSGHSRCDSSCRCTGGPLNLPKAAASAPALSQRLE
jgi:hypothetical protein